MTREDYLYCLLVLPAAILVCVALWAACALIFAMGPVPA